MQRVTHFRVPVQSLCPDTTHAIRDVIAPLFTNGVSDLMNLHYHAYGKVQETSSGLQVLFCCPPLPLAMFERQRTRSLASAHSLGGVCGWATGTWCFEGSTPSLQNVLQGCSSAAFNWPMLQALCQPFHASLLPRCSASMVLWSARSTGTSTALRWGDGGDSSA